MLLDLLPLVLQVLVLVGILIGLLVWSRRANRAGRVGGAVTDAHGAVTGGVWNARVLAGSMLSATYGVIRLDSGTLSFVAEGAVAAAWWAPCTTVVVRRQALGMLTAAPVVLEGPMGVVECEISLERINRVSRNTFKTLRKQGYADGFVRALWAASARQG